MLHQQVGVPIIICFGPTSLWIYMAVVQKNIDPKIDGQLWAATLFGMLAHLQLEESG